MRTERIEPYYLERRKNIFAQGEPSAAWVFFSPEIAPRNDDVSHPFRQNSNYYYLTGFDAPDSISIITYDQETSAPVWHMFIDPKDAEKELWEGPMYGLEGVKEVFGVDQSYPLISFAEKAPELLQNHKHIFYRMGQSLHQDQHLHSVLAKAVRKGGRTGKAYPTVADPQSVLGSMRLIKAEEEINLMRKASTASAHAHKKIIQDLKINMNEREVQGQIDAAFRSQGCSRNGYPSIVASGQNATCLHYTNNNQGCTEGDLLLIDAGGEYGYYTADITRTFPVGDGFSKEQEALYDIVLLAQKECIAAVAPGTTFVELQALAVDILTQGMIDLGLIAEDKDVYIKEKKYRSFYPHNLGHWLGMDVHDVGAYYDHAGKPVAFKKGMVCTIEPGIYIQPHDTQFPEAYRGIGIRIEDDILVTAKGHEVLTKDVPKEKEDILALRASA